MDLEVDGGSRVHAGESRHQGQAAEEHRLRHGVEQLSHRCPVNLLH